MDRSRELYNFSYSLESYFEFGDDFTRPNIRGKIARLLVDKNFTKKKKRKEAYASHARCDPKL